MFISPPRCPLSLTPPPTLPLSFSPHVCPFVCPSARLLPSFSPSRRGCDQRTPFVFLCAVTETRICSRTDQGTTTTTTTSNSILFCRYARAEKACHAPCTPSPCPPAGADVHDPLPLLRPGRVLPVVPHHPAAALVVEICAWRRQRERASF